MLSEISPCIVNRQQQQNVQCNHSNNMSRKKNVPYDINDNNVGEHPKTKKMFCDGMFYEILCNKCALSMLV